MKIRPHIFEDAAEILAVRGLRYTGCCHALYYARASVHEQNFFRRLFRPRDAANYWWEVPCIAEREDQEARVMALLLAAVIAREEAK